MCLLATALLGCVNVQCKTKLLGGLKRLGWLQGLMLSILVTFGGTSMASLLIGLPPPILLDDSVVSGSLLAWILVNSFEPVPKIMSWPFIHHSLVILAEVFRANALCTYVHISIHSSPSALMAVAAGTVAASGGGVFMPCNKTFQGIRSGVPWPLQSAVMGAVVYLMAVGPLGILPAIVRTCISATFVCVALLQTYFGPGMNPAALLSTIIHCVLALPRRIKTPTFLSSYKSSHFANRIRNTDQKNTYIPAVEHVIPFFFITVMVGMVIRKPLQPCTSSLDPLGLISSTVTTVDLQRWLGGAIITPNASLMKTEEVGGSIEEHNEEGRGLSTRLMSLEMRLEEIGIKARCLDGGEALPSVGIAYELLRPARRAVLSLNDIKGEGIGSDNNNQEALIVAEQLSFAENAINTASEVVDKALTRCQQHNHLMCQLGNLTIRPELPFDAQSFAVGISSRTVVSQVDDWRLAVSQSVLHLEAELDNALARGKIAGVIVATDSRDRESGDGEVTKATEEAFDVLKDIRDALGAFPYASEQITTADMMECIDYKLESARNVTRIAVYEVDSAISTEVERSLAADALHHLILDLEATLTSSGALNLSSVFVQDVRGFRSEALLEPVRRSLLDKESWTCGRLSVLDYLHKGDIVLDEAQKVFERIVDTFQTMEHFEKQAESIARQAEDLSMEVLQTAARELRHATKSKLARIKEAARETETQKAFWLLIDASMSDLYVAREAVETLRHSTMVDMEEKNSQRVNALNAVEELKAKLDSVKCTMGYTGMMVWFAQKEMEAITNILSSECWWEGGCKGECGNQSRRRPYNSTANTTDTLVMGLRDAVMRAVASQDQKTLVCRINDGGKTNNNNVELLMEEVLAATMLDSTTTSLPSAGQEKRLGRRLQRAVTELNKCCSGMNEGEGILIKPDSRYWVNNTIFKAQEAVKVATTLWDDRRAQGDEHSSSSSYVELQMVVNQAIIRTAAASRAVQILKERMLEARARQRRGLSLVSAMEVEMNKLMEIGNGRCRALPEVLKAADSLVACKGLVHGPVEHWITPSSLTAAVGGGSSDSEKTTVRSVSSFTTVKNCKAATIVAKEACLKVEKARVRGRLEVKEEAARSDGGGSLEEKEAGGARVAEEADSIVEFCRIEIARSEQKIDGTTSSTAKVSPECHNLVLAMRKEGKRLAIAEEQFRLVEAEVDDVHMATHMDEWLVAARVAIDAARRALTSYKTVQDAVSAVQEAVDAVNEARRRLKFVISAMSATNRRKRKVEMRAIELRKRLQHAASMIVTEGRKSHNFASNAIHHAFAELEILFLQLSAAGSSTTVGDILGGDEKEEDYEWILKHVEQCVKEAKRAASIALQDYRRINALELEFKEVYHEAHRLWPSGLLPKEIEGILMYASHSIANYKGGELIEVRLVVEAARSAVDTEKSANNFRQRALGQLAKVEASIASSVVTLRSSGISMNGGDEGGNVEICCNNCTLTSPLLLLSAIRSICTAKEASHYAMDLINSIAVTENTAEVEDAVAEALKATSVAKREASSASAAAKRVEKDRQALILRVKSLEYDAHAGGVGGRIVDLIPALKEHLARPVEEFLMNPPPPMQVKGMTAFSEEVSLLETQIRTAIKDVPQVNKLVKQHQMTISRMKALESSPFATHLLNCSMETVREKMIFSSMVAERLYLEPISLGRDSTKAFERAVNEFVQAVDSAEADLDSLNRMARTVETEESKTSVELERLQLLLDETKHYNASIWERLEQQPRRRWGGILFFIRNGRRQQQHCDFDGIWGSFTKNQHATTLSRKTCNVHEAVGSAAALSPLTTGSKDSYHQDSYRQCVNVRLSEAVRVRKEVNKGRKKVSRCLNKAKRLLEEQEVGNTTSRAATASFHKFIVASLGVGTYYAAWVLFTIIIG